MKTRDEILKEIKRITATLIPNGFEADNPNDLAELDKKSARIDALLWVLGEKEDRR